MPFHEKNSKEIALKKRELSKAERAILIDKATEAPFSGELLYNKAEGQYLCKQCETPLFNSDQKFESHCGWPSFDDALPDAVTQIPDKDGIRTEIVCSVCDGHLGHIFHGEQLTSKNVRYCVNSLSMSFKEGNENS